MPTFEEFLKVAAQAGWAREQGEVDGGRTVRYLSKGSGADARSVVLPSLADTARLTPVQVAQLCRRTGLDQTQFGLTLGGVGLDDEAP